MDIRVESAIIWAALCVLVGLILLGGCVLCYLALSECHSWICSDGIETRNRKDIESYISPLQVSKPRILVYLKEKGEYE